MIIRRPPWIVSIDEISVEPAGGYIAYLTVDWDLNGNPEKGVPFSLPEESRRDPIGWTPWLWQEIDAGNVTTVRASDQDSSQSPQ